MTRTGWKIGTAIAFVMMLGGCDDMVESYVAPEQTFDREQDVGPLGVNMRMDKEDFSGLRELDYNFYFSSNVPRDSTLFDNYRLQFAPTGVCALAGIGRDVETTPDGEGLKREYARIYGALTEKYGQAGREDDYLIDNAKLTGDDEWIKALSIKERVYAAYWYSSEEVDFPNDIESVSLRSWATDDGVGYVVVRYEFDNYDECAAMDKARELEDL